MRAELLRGDLNPGDRLRQDEVAGRLGISKIPVREALHRLAGLGLLRFERNRGALVPQFTVADAMENFALRQAVEPVLLDQAIANLTIVDLAEAEHALDPVPGRTSTEANWAFHWALYRASGWERGLAIASNLHVSAAPYVLLYTRELGGGVDSDAQHRALLQACRERDRPTAAQLLNSHLDDASQAVLDFLRSRSECDPDRESGERT